MLTLDAFFLFPKLCNGSKQSCRIFGQCKRKAVILPEDLLASVTVDANHVHV